MVLRALPARRRYRGLAGFVERVRSEGGEVALRVFEGVVHGFYTLGKLIPEAREAVALSAAALRSHLAECAQS